ncbi:MAG TPA: glycosyltransferase [Xanthobacteraceae bacterium]|nr:glycosyltransferase [Xanthobacteraceae bacterium]
MRDLISIVVSTYERADALDAVLRSLARQRDRGFEVIVADDGSGPATAAVIARWNGELGAPLFHARHEHVGFRAAEIRNRAIALSHGAYCVFLDGDCIPRADFVAQHRRLAEPGWFVAGNRILLSEALTRAVLAERLEPQTWDLAALLRHRGNGVNRIAPALHLPLGPLRKAEPRRWEGARTCNLAVARRDLDRVDGFDASFNGWGLEDSDLAVRLIHAGVRRKDGRFATGVFHLWHRDNDRAGFAGNQARLDDVIRSDRIRALRGLSTLAPDPCAGACLT